MMQQLAVPVALGRDHLRGSLGAAVTLLEYGDYECPHCGVAHPILQKFAKAHPDVRLCVLPFPLSGHPNGAPAAQAALPA